MKFVPGLLKKQAGEKKVRLPYEAKPFLLSKAENSFYQVIYKVLGSNYHIYPKVRLADIVKVKKGTENYRAAFNRIQSKHLDFVVCDKFSKPRLVIELDDSSHLKQSAIKNDRFKDELFETVGLRFIRFKAQRAYNVEEIRGKLVAKKAESAKPEQEVCGASSIA